MKPGRITRDAYTDLDRFGRVVNQLWTTSDTTNGTSGDTLGTITDQFQYGYDQNSNVLYKNNVVHSAASELYHANGAGEVSAYDSLNRLTGFRRGTLSASGSNGTTLDTVTTASATNSGSLDALGNSTNTGGTSRTVNSKNQITGITGLTTPTYDHDGNMTTDQAGTTYTYDAWNCLIWALPHGQYSQGETYTYNAIGERPGMSINICNGAVTSSYYSTQWQDLEDDVTTYVCGPTTTKSTYLWSISYIDDLIAHDTGSTRVYAEQDANHDITSLVNSSGTVSERFIYDPYGARTVLNASWSSASDSQNWVYSFQGGRLDPISGLVNFRNRDLNPTTGTWMEQDPWGYVEGADVYQLELSNPANMLDPLGESGQRPTTGPTTGPSTQTSTQPTTLPSLSWADFQGKAPQNPEEDAYINAELTTNPGPLKVQAQKDPCQGWNATAQYPNITVTAPINKDKSWVVAGQQTDTLRTHELYHLLILQIGAPQATQKMRKLTGHGSGNTRRQAETAAIADLNAQIQAAFTQAQHDTQAQSDAYDTATNHGTNSDQQNTWQNKVNGWQQSGGWD